MMTMLGMASLSIDYGRVVLAKTELRSAADAAARAAVLQLDGTDTAAEISRIKNAAVQVAAMNIANGTSVILDPNDVQVGNWDTTQTTVFSTTREPINAVKVTTRLDAAHSSSIQLQFAATLGVPTFDVAVASVACNPGPTSTYGFSGIQSIAFGSVGVLAQVCGDLASDGNISVGNPLGLGVKVTGDCCSVNGTVSRGTLARIDGNTAPLSSSLYYPDAAIPDSNNNAQIASYLDSHNNFSAVVYADIPAGTYVVNDLNFLAGIAVNLHGPVTFYVTGCFNMAATINLLGQPNTDPSNLTVKVLNGGTVNFLANLVTPLAMKLYAPRTAVDISVGINHYTGSIIAKTSTINLPVLGTFTEQKLAASSTISIVQ